MFGVKLFFYENISITPFIESGAHVSFGMALDLNLPINLEVILHDLNPSMINKLGVIP